MKIVSCENYEGNQLLIHSFGKEENSDKAFWGKGRREYYIIHYVLSGEGEFNGRSVSAGQGFLIYPDQLHEYHSSVNKPWKYVWVIFAGTKAEYICKKHIETDKDGIFSYDFKSELLVLFDSILNSNYTISPAKALCSFFKLMSLHEKSEENGDNEYVKEAKKYMKLHYYRKLSILEVADHLGINDRYLYNLFIKNAGISPKEYLSQIRISRAKELLLQSENTISQIAVSCGFSDVLSFSHFFSSKTDTSPTDYRNKKFKNK